jgi:hypothetical protein
VGVSLRKLGVGSHHNKRRVTAKREFGKVCMAWATGGLTVFSAGSGNDLTTAWVNNIAEGIGDTKCCDNSLTYLDEGIT